MARVGLDERALPLSMDGQPVIEDTRERDAKAEKKSSKGGKSAASK